MIFGIGTAPLPGKCDIEERLGNLPAPAACRAGRVALGTGWSLWRGGTALAGPH